MVGGRTSPGASLWRVVVTAPDACAAEAATRAIETVCGAVSAFEAAPGGTWRVDGIAAERPDKARLEAALAVALAGWGEGAAEGAANLQIERMPPQDWLAENQASFPPIAARRYFIHGSHYARPVPAGRIGLLIDAATAFGTGEHATTRGCLSAIDAIAKAGQPRRVLDMGTGTGVLAIAAARTWRRRVWGRDIEAEAVRVAAHNAARNGVAALVSVKRGAGYRDRGLARIGRFDLILANILARPLAAMAPDLARRLAPGGLAVLSGLLGRQEAYVLAAHRAQHLHLVRRIAIDGWHTLVLARDRPRARVAGSSS